MASDTLQLVVRFLHILFAFVWVGGIFFFLHAVSGALRRAPPQVGGPAMLAIGDRMTPLFSVSGPLTLGFGLLNQYLIDGRLAFQGTTWHVALGASVFLTLIMLGIAFGVSIPAFKKLKALAPKGPPPAGSPPPAPSPEVLALRKRMMLGGIANGAIGMVVIALMVVATVARVSGA